MLKYVFILMVYACATSGIASAQIEAHQDLQETVPATVLEIISVEEKEILGTDTIVTIQDVRAEVHEGLRAGTVVTFENELTTLEAGDKVLLNRLVAINGDEYFVFKDVHRLPLLALLAGIFIALLIIFAGVQGIRAVASLSISIAAILFVLIPALLAGYDPVFTSLAIASVILAVVLFGTHGFNARATTAFLGTTAAVLLTGGIATLFVSAMRLTGFSSDASIYLNFATFGSLDFAGLLLGSIIIGILGILDDVSITQASVVQELKAANNTLTHLELYKRALRVGRDHVGSLVNTLALAYVGVSLPLVLLYANAGSDLMLTLNQEIVAAELTRIMVGSIGLILAVPLTTLIAAWWFGRKDVVVLDEDIPHHCGHHHH